MKEEAIMLFTEAQLNNANPISILDEATYLTEDEVIIIPDMIPVRQIKRLGEGVTMVRFDDVATLAERYNTSYIDAMIAIAEASQVDRDLMTVAVDEDVVLATPEVIKLVENVVIAPISDEDPVYQICEAAIDAYAESGDESILESILQEWTEDDGRRFGPIDSTKDYFWSLGHHARNIGKNGLKGAGKSLVGAIERNPTGVGTALSATPFGLPIYLYGKANSVHMMYNRWKNRPRNAIAKKIASLRKLYAKWLYRGKIERDDGRASLIKKVCVNIMSLIDKLLQVLQKGANKLSS